MAAPVRRSTFAGSMPQGGEDLESKHLGADADSYGATGPPKRHTFTEGEASHQSRWKTWTIDDSVESMDDVSIVINLLADLSPAGVLPLSFGMIGTGYIPSIILLCVFALCAGYMMYLISRTIRLTQELGDRKCISYDRIWAKIIGPRTAWIPTFTVFSVTFGCCLAYACMFGDLFAGCMPAFGVTFATRTFCLIFLAVLPLLPLCMLKDLSMLAPTSFAALLSVLYTLVMMVIRYLDGSYVEGGAFFTTAPPPAGDHSMTFGAPSFLLVNGLAVAFLCHYNGCKYYREFIGHNPPKFSARIALAFVLVSSMFAVAMLAGYATFGGLSSGVILNNYAPNDMLANVARVAMGVANVCSFPLMFSGLREQALALITFISPSMEGTCSMVWFQNIFSGIMLAFITMLAVIITDCSLVVGLVGSICGSATIYVLPCVLFDAANLKCEALGIDMGTAYTLREKILVRSIAVIGILLMVGGAAATLML